MSELLQLPVVPLRNSVVFPGLPQSIQVGRPGTLKAVQRALDAEERLVFAVLQRADGEQVEPAGLHELGTIARIDQIEPASGTLGIVLHGQRRARVVRYEERGELLLALVASVADVAPASPDDAAFAGLVREVRERALEAGRRSGTSEAVLRQHLASAEDAGALADLVAGSLDMPSADRQALLAEPSVEARLRRVLTHLERQIAVLAAQRDIHSKVQQELGERQREVVLREQLKAIRHELGEDGGADDLAELRARLDAIALPEDARREVNRELARLERIGREGPESQVARSFLETIAELPWDTRTADVHDLDLATRILDEDHFGLPEVKDRVLEHLAVRKLGAARAAAAGEAPPRSPILLFAGPPGVGKTSIAKSIARALGRAYAKVSLGGVRDDAEVRGHRRTYVGALPGRIIAALRQAKSKNPVIVLDEIDKLGVSMQGDPSSALLEVLDPAQNDRFVDHYLGVGFDLSEVLFVATANIPERIAPPLLDRLEVIEFRGYTEAEKLEIARRYLVPRQRRENAIPMDALAIDDGALGHIISHHTREAGVRGLERELAKLMRKAARALAAGGATKVDVDQGEVDRLLGRPKARPERALGLPQVGVATGMYYTPAGGDIMFVEATTMPGKGELAITGQLGEVMRESARAAWSWVRANASALGVGDGAFGRRDLHIHVPAGAVPKDGPSAGVALAVALASVATGIPARPDLAMTGEVTLSGRVLPVGGIKEKVLGALRAGIRRIVLPAENARDFDELPAAARAALDVSFVEQLDQVLELALVRPPRVDAAGGRLAPLGIRGFPLEPPIGN